MATTFQMQFNISSLHNSVSLNSKQSSISDRYESVKLYSATIKARFKLYIVGQIR